MCGATRLENASLTQRDQVAKLSRSGEYETGRCVRSGGVAVERSTGALDVRGATIQ